MKNLLFITSSTSFGGAAKILCFIAESLAERGYNVTIANLKITQNVTNYERNFVNAKVILVKNNKHNVDTIHHLKNICKNVKADAIIGFTAFPNMYAVILGKLLHIPSIISERGDPFRTFDKSIKSKFMKLIINQATGGVFQTDGAKKFYGTRLQNCSRIIPNPILLTGEVPNVKFEERKKTIVYVGRIENQQKRLDITLKAFQIFNQHYPNYILKIYGRGTQENEIKQCCVELGIQDKVKFMGLTTNVMKDIAYDGMFLITSDYEGISNSLLEAMAVGLPCISTDHTPGGARLLIENKENGLLVPIGDYKSVANAMCEFVENPLLAKKCGENARDVTNRFNPKHIIDIWEEYILSIINYQLS